MAWLCCTSWGCDLPVMLPALTRGHSGLAGGTWLLPGSLQLRGCLRGWPGALLKSLAVWLTLNYLKMYYFTCVVFVCCKPHFQGFRYLAWEGRRPNKAVPLHTLWSWGQSRALWGKRTPPIFSGRLLGAPANCYKFWNVPIFAKNTVFLVICRWQWI